MCKSYNFFSLKKLICCLCNKISIGYIEPEITSVSKTVPLGAKNLCDQFGQEFQLIGFCAFVKTEKLYG